MKKICCLLSIMLIMGCVSVYSSENAPVVMKYTAAFNTTQGIDNWYYYEWGKGTENKLSYDSSLKQWKNPNNQYPHILAESGNSGDTDVGYRFVAPQKGMLRLKGKVVCPWPDGVKGDGIIASIVKGQKQLWSQRVIYGNDANYEVYLSIRKGEAVDFRINKGSTNYYDWWQWLPTVEYLGIEYIGEEDGYTYFEKKNGEMTPIPLDAELDIYKASDGIAFVDGINIMPSEEYSLVKRYTVSEQGRYRVNCTIEGDDRRSGGTIVKVYKNGEKFWEQLCADRETCNVDVRAFANVGDTIDVEVAVNEYVGYNKLNWKCDVVKYVGTLPCIADTSAGKVNGTLKEFTLSSLISSTQGANGVEYYSVKYDVKTPMQYNATNKRWESQTTGSGGFISPATVFSGNDTDAVIEVEIEEDGLIRIDGGLDINSAGDGVVCKVLLNDETIWSSRVGGERPVRWDEPFDVSYFAYDMDVVARANSGDKITFLFDQWRRSINDNVGIGNIKLSYISGDVVSMSTRHKLAGSIVVDTQAKAVYNGKEKFVADVFVMDGTTYIAKGDANLLFGQTSRAGRNINGTEYVALRDVAEDNGKNVVWAADRLVIIHDGIPVMFGWTELSEIKTALEGGVLFE